MAKPGSKKIVWVHDLYSGNIHNIVTGIGLVNGLWLDAMLMRWLIVTHPLRVLFGVNKFYLMLAIFLVIVWRD